MEVEFDDENTDYTEKYRTNILNIMEKKSKMIQFLIEKKIVKDKKSAEVFLIVVIILSFLIAGYLIYNISKPDKIEYNLSPDVLKTLPNQIKENIYESQK